METPAPKAVVGLNNGGFKVDPVTPKLPTMNKPFTATITPQTVYTLLGKPLMAMHVMMTGHTEWKLEAEGGARLDQPMKVYAKCHTCGQRLHVATMTLRLTGLGVKA